MDKSYKNKKLQQLAVVMDKYCILLKIDILTEKSRLYMKYNMKSRADMDIKNIKVEIE